MKKLGGNDFSPNIFSLSKSIEVAQEVVMAD
jgi:hypothetical protein